MNLNKYLFRELLEYIILFLTQVEEETLKTLKERHPKENYEIHCFEEEAGFSIVKISTTVDQDGMVTEEELPLAVNVSLTSNKVREIYESRLEQAKKKVNNFYYLRTHIPYTFF